MKRKFALMALAALVCGSCLILGFSCGDGNHSDSGGTNIQVEGVDEGDFTKHVGNYLYLLQEDGITVSLCKDDGSVILVSTYSQDNVSPQEMYISDNRLITLYTYERLDENKTRIWSGLRIFDLKNMKEDYSFSSNILYSLDFKGEYRDSRIVIEKQKMLLCYRTYTTELTAQKDSDGNYASRDTVLCYEINGEKSTVCKPEKLRNIPEYLTSEDVTVYATIDLKNNSFTSKFKATYGFPFNTLYVSEYGFYTAYTYTEYKRMNRGCVSNIQNIDHSMIARIDGESLALTAQKFFDGMYLVSRQAVKDTGKNVYFAMLNTNYHAMMMIACDANLNLVGYLSDIFQDESLKSVSYVEENGKIYCNLVSYKQQINLDPLFKIDVSDPKNMYVCGLLSVDGYSDYLYDFAGGYTIGIGEDGNSNVKVSLFHTAENFPTEIKSFVFDENSNYQSSSEATKNSHAFCVDRKNRLFSIPLEQYDINQKIFFKRLYFYQVYGENENVTLLQLGYIESDQSGGTMRRAFFDEKYVYAVGEKQIKSFLLSYLLEGKVEQICCLNTTID